VRALVPSRFPPLWVDQRSQIGEETWHQATDRFDKLPARGCYSRLGSPPIWHYVLSGE